MGVGDSGQVRLKKRYVAALLAVVGLTIVGQSVTIRHVNPEIAGDVAATPKIAAIFKRACYDCHSNETRWPWYSYLALLSWWIERDVELGRKELNFSEWGSYYPATKMRKLHWLDRTLHQENMPPWSYRMLHPQAALNQADLMLLEQWIEAQLAAQRLQKSPHVTTENSQ
mgnify:FL=1